MKRFICIIAAVSLLVASGCAKKTERYRAEFLSIFDTVTIVVGYSESKEEFVEHTGQIKEQLAEYHRLFDIYNSYEGLNNLKTINDNAGIKPVKVDKKIISLLSFAKELYYTTHGKLNIALGAVLRIWHEYREKGILDPQSAELPAKELLEAAARHSSIENIKIDEEAQTVYLADPKMSLDVGAVAKGYAVEQVARHLEEKGVSSLLISVGGNVRALGGKSGKNGEEPWNIAVKNPDKEEPDADLCNLFITDCSVVSSGSYERYYTVEGTMFHHIIDPGTLLPASYFKSVTVVCPDSGLADALSTAVFIMPLEMGREFIDSLAGVEALWVLDSGEIVYSKNFRLGRQIGNTRGRTFCVVSLPSTTRGDGPSVLLACHL
ncbi:MAG: FAD:protein FMN transferase [Firmicutes bacterium]|mgnify:FL=1|nr:FAD:protein FMN transferase [Bacillota bacterium]